MDQQTPKQQFVEKVRNASSILVTVSKNPSVDQVSAAIGLSLMLNKLDLHTTTVMSGDIPPVMKFLHPEQTIKHSVAGLRDFVISLAKDKADKFRYHVDDDNDMLKIIVTPANGELKETDFSFEQGDIAVDLIVALGVHKKEDLDEAIKSHGKILHDASIVTVNTDALEAPLGSIAWSNEDASCISEMLVSVSEALQGGLIDQPIATALLTGIVSETDHFRKDNTTPKLMTMAAQLMAAGANQQLIARNLDSEVSKNKLRTNSDGDQEFHVEHESHKNKKKKPQHKKQGRDRHPKKDHSSKKKSHKKEPHASKDDIEDLKKAITSERHDDVAKAAIHSGSINKDISRPKNETAGLSDKSFKPEPIEPADKSYAKDSSKHVFTEPAMSIDQIKPPTTAHEEPKDISQPAKNQTSDADLESHLLDMDVDISASSGMPIKTPEIETPVAQPLPDLNNISPPISNKPVREFAIQADDLSNDISQPASMAAETPPPQRGSVMPASSDTFMGQDRTPAAPETRPRNQAGSFNIGAAFDDLAEDQPVQAQPKASIPQSPAQPYPATSAPTPQPTQPYPAISAPVQQPMPPQAPAFSPAPQSPFGQPAQTQPYPATAAPVQQPMPPQPANTNPFTPRQHLGAPPINPATPKPVASAEVSPLDRAQKAVAKQEAPKLLDINDARAAVSRAANGGPPPIAVPSTPPPNTTAPAINPLHPPNQAPPTGPAFIPPAQPAATFNQPTQPQPPNPAAMGAYSQPPTSLPPVQMPSPQTFNVPPPQGMSSVPPPPSPQTSGSLSPFAPRTSPDNLGHFDPQPFNPTNNPPPSNRGF